MATEDKIEETDPVLEEDELNQLISEVRGVIPELKQYLIEKRSSSVWKYDLKEALDSIGADQYRVEQVLDSLARLGSNQESPPVDPNTSRILLDDLLSSVSRKQRRNLLGMSLLAFAVTLANLRPSSISALGITSDALNLSSLLFLLGSVVIFFLCGFLIYAYSDFLEWRIKYSLYKQKHEHKFEEKLETSISRSSVVKAFFEFAVPIIIALVAIYVTFREAVQLGAT
jgi:hypothetical protein